jgi:uncharacterized protein
MTIFTSKNLEKLKSQARSFLDTESCGHDFLHCLRVANLADIIASSDFPNTNREILLGAAIVHDLCRPWERRTGKSHFCDEALQIIDGELEKAGFAIDSRHAILEIVRWHDVYDPTRIPSFSPELQIHQDADRLDAIGAIGIARTFSFGGANNLPMYIPGENLDFDGYFIEAPDHRTSIIAHFHEKLLKLHDQMHTPMGKSLASVRHRRMKQFIADFFDEWGDISS